MALINCPECSKNISDQATSCPNCGHPIKNNESQRVKTSEDSVLTRNRGCADIILFAFLGIILIIAFITFISLIGWY